MKLNMTSFTAFLLCIVANSMSTGVQGAVVRYTNQALWQNATQNNFTTIGFTGYPDNTLITNQFSSLGVTFLQPPPFVYPNNGFHDGWGAGSFPGFSTISMTFAAPMRWIGVLFPGSLEIFLYSQGQLVYTSDPFDHSFSPFAGLISDTNFDKVVLDGPSDCTIDDIFFGPSVPAPGSLTVIALTCFFTMSRRRRI